MYITAWKPPERFRQNKYFTGGHMTKKECKEAMLRGLGRCVIAVQNTPEKYRDMVLWACKRNFAYDAQIEGTRSWYVYTMVNCYADKAPFIDAAANALKNYRSNGGWDLLHLSELLMFFAMDGNKAAHMAVEEKYQELFSALLARKRRPNRVFHELADLEQLGLVLSVDRASFLSIAKDFGRLYREKGYLCDGDFEWFFSSKGSRYQKALERAAQKDKNLTCFLEREQANLRAREKQLEQRKAEFPNTLTEVRLSRWLLKNADEETVNRYALSYREQSEPNRRAEVLAAFSVRPYPDDPQPILEDTQSHCEELQTAAWRALDPIRHPAVRAFALQNARNGIRTSENFALLTTNYLPQDGDLLEDLLREMIAQRDWDAVHTAGMDIFRAFYKDSGIPHPKHLLPILYTYTPCSYCRESALEYLAKHRILTNEILEECLFDSNEDIRIFAKKRLKKRFNEQ